MMRKCILFSAAFVSFFIFTLSSQEKIEVDEKTIAQELGLEWPVKDTAKTLEQLDEELKELAEKSVNQKYPPKTQEEFRKEVIEKYPLYKPGDKVTVKVKYRNSILSISGTFKKITASSLYIDSKSYPLVDIDKKVASQFSESAWNQLITQTTNKLFTRHETDRRFGAEDYISKHKNDHYKANNYSLVDGKWIKNSEYLKNAVAKKVEEMEAEKRRIEQGVNGNKSSTKSSSQQKSTSSREGTTAQSNSKSPANTKDGDPYGDDFDEGFEEETDKKAGIMAIVIMGIYVIMILNQLAWLFAIFFEDGFLWLIGVLFIPFVGLILLIKNWQSYKKFFFVHIILIIALIACIAVIGSSS